MSNQERTFIQQALARVEKEEKRQRIKHWIFKVLALGAVLTWAIGTSSPKLPAECIVLVGVGVIVMVGTTKILATVNGNTKAILQALADTRSGESSGTRSVP